MHTHPPYKKVLPNTYTYRTKTAEPTEQRIEENEKKRGLDSPKMSLPKY